MIGPSPSTGSSENDEDDEDGAFPPVESPSGEHGADPPASRDFSGGTPPPFGADSRTSGELSATALPPVAVNKRGIVWPLLALAMVGITALALLLVWKQTQQPKEVIITQEPARDPVGEPAVDVPAAGDDQAPADAVRGGAGAGGASTEVARPPSKVVRPPPPNPYNAVIKSYRPQMNKCVQDNPLPPGNVKMVIVVATTGRPKTVSFEPGSLDATPAGACIRSALSTATFPAAKEERTVTVPVSVPVKRS
jgi:hypothetical protein